VDSEVRHHAAGLDLTEREFAVPLDHDDPEAGSLTVFAREVAARGGGDRPYLVFLQGGPGHEAPRPLRREGWLDRALDDYRVLLLDQRGTGRSTPVRDLPGLIPEEQAAYLTRFRADSIVRDAEWIRRALEVDSWSVLGQSFGGFCVVTYLSFAPEGLREAFVTGGLPPIGRPTDDVYRATYTRVIDRNRRYFERYPHDLDRVRRLHETLAARDVRLPSGDRLTVRRFRQLGTVLGMSDGAETLHYLLERPLDSPGFLHDVEAATGFARHPLYAVVHEACYADGCSTRWSADRLLPEVDDLPIFFTGEHVFRWQFSDYGALKPLAEAADILAEHPWPRLYDAGRLARNEVPTAAAIYANDMYVERAFSEETAAAIGGLRPWLTNEYEHNGLRLEGERVLGRLIELLRS